LKTALRELQKLRERAAADDRHERVAVIGFAFRTPLAVDPLHIQQSFDEICETALASAVSHETGCVNRIGMFVGVHADGCQVPAMFGGSPLLSRQVSERFDLLGQTFTISNGATSALAAIHLARLSLLNHDCDLVIAGGLTLAARAEGRSPDSMGEMGLVVLERLADARSARHPVRALVLASGTRFTQHGADDLADLVRSSDVAPDAALRRFGCCGDLSLDDGARGLAALRNTLAEIESPVSRRDGRGALAAEWTSGPARVHLLLAPAEPEVRATSSGPQFIALSGRTSDELTGLIDALAGALRDHPDYDLVDVAHTLRVRPLAAVRQTVIAEDSRNLLRLLSDRKTLGLERVCSRSDRGVTFLLPGLGNHHVSMGRDLYRAQPIFREAIDRCAALLQAHLGTDIRSVLEIDSTASTTSEDANSHSAGPDLRAIMGRRTQGSRDTQRQLRRTLFAQPALFVVEYALVEWCRAHGISPVAMLGYSIGEYVAAQQAGIFSLDDALKLVASRARLIEGLAPGAMLAVALPESVLASRLGGDVWLSASSGDELSVVAGAPQAIDRLAAALAAEAIAAQVLPTTHAFHTPLMRPIEPEFRRVLAAIDLRPPSARIVSGLTGTWMTDEQATSPDYWVEHTCEPVRFGDAVALLRRTGHDLFLELGPGAALSSVVLGVGTSDTTEPPQAIAAMRHESDTQNDVFVLQRAAAALWIAGGRVDWEAFGAQYQARRVSLTVDRIEPTSPGIRHAADAGPAPAGGLESILHRLWSDVLKNPHIDPALTFFELGGNSLTASQLVFRVHKTLRVEIPLRAIYEAPTIPALAHLIEGRLNGHAPTSAVAPDAVPAARGMQSESHRLPNGLSIVCHNKAEIAHFYEDIFVNRAYLRHGLTLPAGSTVFDVGANVGLFTLFVHLNCEDARLFAFEPAPAVFDLLRANVATHGVAARLFPCALSSRPGRGRLTFYPNSSGMSSLYGDHAEERLVLETILTNQANRGETEVASLLTHADDYFAERLRRQDVECTLSTVSAMMAAEGVSSLELLKIDVQKSEYDVLLGIEDRDWPRIRQIVAEVHDVNGRVGEVARLLAGKGYDVVVEQEALYAGSAMHNVYARRLSA
jgi:FkbM family methyltransferase